MDKITINTTKSRITCLTKINLDVNKLENIITFIFETENASANDQLNVVIADNKFLQDLNKRFRNIDRPTDVLSFSLEDEKPSDSNSVLGDVYISSEKAVSQATEYGVPLQIEIERLMIHGILHLLGYEHDESRKRKIMEKKTEYFMNYFPKEQR
ncbi:MAG: rRNA maturation RNase YbeY [Candidatus Cloacimonadota bacterium]|nr:rRNA maturation RNase YbeY [Candidatus Cloacimonadota bacterium]